MFKNWAHGWLLLHFTNTGWHDENTFFQYHVKFTSCCNLIYSVYLLEYFGIYISNFILENMGRQRITSIDFNHIKCTFASGPTCKVDVLSYIPIIYCCHFTFVSFPLAPTYYPICPTNAKWLVIFILDYGIELLYSIVYRIYDFYIMSLLYKLVKISWTYSMRPS